jgi:hypothetical protein
MDELTDDLILLAARPDGRLDVPAKLRFGVSGSELVRLAAARRVDVVRGRIVVLDTAPTGDPLLDEALRSIQDSRRPPTAKAWVARQRRNAERHLDRLADAGTVRAHGRKLLGFIPVTTWTITDTARAAQARARLEAIAATTGSVDSAQAALAGLATAIGVTQYVFPGFGGAAARKRLKDAGKRDPAAVAAAGAASDAVSAASDAAVRGATDAAISAATDAAIAASVDAATQAAISAATDAATSAAHHGGGAAGGHH